MLASKNLIYYIRFEENDQNPSSVFRIQLFSEVFWRFLLNRCSKFNSDKLAPTYSSNTSWVFYDVLKMAIFGHFEHFGGHFLITNGPKIIFFEPGSSLPILSHTKINSHINENSKKYFFNTPWPSIDKVSQIWQISTEPFRLTLLLDST